MRLQTQQELINDYQDFAPSYTWDIFIDGLPKPWFSAIDVEENLLTVVSHDFPLYLSTYKVPASTASFDLKVTFYDDDKHVLSQWFANWANKLIFPGMTHVATLEEACKRCYVWKNNRQRQPVQKKSYWVYPDGALYFNGNSDSGLVTYTQDLIIAGTIE